MTTAGKTLVITDPEDIMSSATSLFSNVKERIDCCADDNAPISHSMLKPVRDGFIQLKNRGIKVRFITEITKENLYYSKQLMKNVELRHLDGIKGNFGISDGVEYRASPTSKQEGIPSEYIISTVKSFVEQQQYFFETLWSKAIPATQRIKEIEKGSKREFVETIRDPSEIQKLGFDLIRKAEQEILILFSAANAFRRQVKAGALALLKEAATQRSIKIRILVPADDNNTIITTNETIRQLKEVGVDIQQMKKEEQLYHLQSKLTMLIVDQSVCLTVELEEEEDTEEETSEEAITLATYSNSESTVFTYSSIFENLWINVERTGRQQHNSTTVHKQWRKNGIKAGRTMGVR
jgi:two-component system, OmpR family, sensor histidine kinase VicK